MSITTLSRCPWCEGDPLYEKYHDEEWGVPKYDSRFLFEMLILEGAQAGLSWITILRKREGYRAAFADFDPERIAAFTEKKEDQLLQNKEIIRNRLKVKAAITNARAFLDFEEKQGSFSDFIWHFVDGKQVINHWNTLDEVPAQTPTSQAMSKQLKKLGFKFVGPTICYAYMQSVGLVNDHLVGCHCHPGN